MTLYSDLFTTGGGRMKERERERERERKRKRIYFWRERKK
jgi:hypothetical protein